VIKVYYISILVNIQFFVVSMEFFQSFVNFVVVGFVVVGFVVVGFVRFVVGLLEFVVGFVVGLLGFVVGFVVGLLGFVRFVGGYVENLGSVESLGFVVQVGFVVKFASYVFVCLEKNEFYDVHCLSFFLEY